MPQFFEVEPHLKGFHAFLDEFNRETERGAALTAAAYLDDLFERVIAAFLIPNDSGLNLTSGFSAPLGSLAARIAACHALGLISEREFHEAEIIRNVRNEFAHKLNMSFNDDRLKSLCGKMQMSVPGEKSARGQFVSGAIVLLMHLTNRPHYVAQKGLKYGEWKI